MILRFIFIGMLQLACGQTTTYDGDGYCNDNDEACEAYSFLFWDYAKVRMVKIVWHIVVTLRSV